MISGLAARALASLSTSQRSFLASLEKAELHAHLNGSIPLEVLQELARERLQGISRPSGSDACDDEAKRVEIVAGLEKLSFDLNLDSVHDFFSLFPAIYSLTSSPESIALSARAVLSSFLGSPSDQREQTEQSSTYLELRTTPRSNPSFKGSRLEYLEAVLSAVEAYPLARCALIVSIDRRMKEEDIRECVELAIRMKHQGRRIVGLDLCGEPLAGDLSMFRQYFRLAKESGLGVTLHIAELKDCTEQDTLDLLSFDPDRLGHATFLSEGARKVVIDKKIPIEVCLSSNLLCKTVSRLEDHHIRYYLQHKHPVVICTDDALPFRTSLLAEYALLLASPPVGLGLCEQEVVEIARMGMDAKFSTC